MKKIKIFNRLFLIVFLIGMIFFIYKLAFSSPVKDSVTVEAGIEKLEVDDFLKEPNSSAILFKKPTIDELQKIGKYEVEISISGKIYKSEVKIEDTIPPVAETVKVECWVGEEISPDMFVKDIKDVTSVSCVFRDEITTENQGSYLVTVILEDEGKNKKIIESELTVKEDKEPPVIVGAKNKTVYLGEAVTYRTGISIQDNKDSDLSFTVDTSKVNLSKSGKYEAIYKAVDKSGNTASKTITIEVKEKPKSYVTEDEVYAKADSILKKIINNNMSKREKCRKIFDWVKSHVSYVSTSDKSSWTKAAMQAFDKGKGDCYNFWAVTKVLLTRAGIENIDLKATKHTHYWNFVKVEEGWYHLDTTPRKDRPNLFLKTDEWIDAYSLKHSNCFSYSKEGKPESAKS